MVRAPVASLVTVAALTTFASFVPPTAPLALSTRVRCYRFAGLIQKFFKDFALGGFRDIDTPPGQFGGEASVLPIFADGERELLLRHGDERGVIGLTQLHPERFDRTERVGDEGGRVWTPLDDIYFLIVEFAHNVVDARPPHPDAGADGVKPFLACDICHFGAATRLACNGLDFDRPLVDFWYFRLEKAAHKVAMGTRDQNLQHTTLDAAHIVDIDAQALPRTIAFGWYFLGRRHDAFNFVSLIEVKINGPTAHGVFARERTKTNLTNPVLDLIVKMLVLRFTDALQDDLLGRLRRDFGEDVGRIDVDHLPQRRMWIEPLCLRQRDLLVAILNLGDHALRGPDMDFAVFINLYADVFTTAEAFAISR